jgi:hypothetical protein
MADTTGRPRFSRQFPLTMTDQMYADLNTYTREASMPSIAESIRGFVRTGLEAHRAANEVRSKKPSSSKRG